MLALDIVLDGDVTLACHEIEDAPVGVALGGVVDCEPTLVGNEVELAAFVPVGDKPDGLPDETGEGLI